MVDTYKQEKKFNNYIHEIIKLVVADSTKEINVSSLAIDIGLKFGFSRYKLENKIEQYLQLYPQLQLMENKLVNIDSKMPEA